MLKFVAENDGGDALFCVQLPEVSVKPPTLTLAVSVTVLPEPAVMVSVPVPKLIFPLSVILPTAFNVRLAALPVEMFAPAFSVMSPLPPPLVPVFAVWIVTDVPPARTLLILAT